MITVIVAPGLHGWQVSLTDWPGLRRAQQAPEEEEEGRRQQRGQLCGQEEVSQEGAECQEDGHSPEQDPAKPHRPDGRLREEEDQPQEEWLRQEVYHEGKDNQRRAAGESKRSGRHLYQGGNTQE